MKTAPRSRKRQIFGCALGHWYLPKSLFAVQFGEKFRVLYSRRDFFDCLQWVMAAFDVFIQIGWIHANPNFSALIDDHDWTYSRCRVGNWSNYLHLNHFVEFHLHFITQCMCNSPWRNNLEFRVINEINFVLEVLAASELTAVFCFNFINSNNESQLLAHGSSKDRCQIFVDDFEYNDLRFILRLTLRSCLSNHGYTRFVICDNSFGA